MKVVVGALQRGMAHVAGKVGSLEPTSTLEATHRLRFAKAKWCRLCRARHHRHRFAVKFLVTWYKAGVDVQGMLPALATYMEHVHFTDTAYYLTATAELLTLSGARYQKWLDEKGEDAS